MKTHLICQNSMTGAIHVLEHTDNPDYNIVLTPCGYYLAPFEKKMNSIFKRKNTKVCIKCHKSLKKSHDKDLIAHISYLKLKGMTNDRIKI